VTLVFRYFAAELVRGYLVIGAALLVLFDLIAFLTEAEDIGDARYDLLDALVVVTYSTPALLVDLAPFIALLATLYAFANLDSRAELTAMRAAGTSRRWFAMTGAAVAFFFMVGIGLVELVARPLHLEASVLRLYKKAETGNPLQGSGFWTRRDDTFVNVARLEDGQNPLEIRIFTFTADGALSSYARAAGANVLDKGQWQLNDVRRRRYAEGAPVTFESEAHELWTPVWPADTDLYALTVASLSLRDLIFRVGEDAEDQTNRAELWRRLVLPISAMAYAALAVAFVLTSGVRGGKSGRMAVGAALAFLLYLAEQLVVNAGILAGLPIALVSLVPCFVVFLLAALLIRRAP